MPAPTRGSSGAKEGPGQADGRADGGPGLVVCDDHPIIREQLADPDTRIVRPQQVYVGEWLRPAVEAIGERAEPPAGNASSPFGKGAKPLAPVFGEVPPSNAYRRRVAGSNWA